MANTGKVYNNDGDNLVVASGGTLDIESGGALEIAGVLLGKANLFPDHIQREVGHVAQVDQQVHLPGKLDLEKYQLLEFLEVGQGEFAEYGEFDKMVLVLCRDHDESPWSGE